MDHLANLRSSRGALTAKLADVGAALDRVRSAEAAETRLLAEIASLGAAEVERMKEWARSGAHGEPPAIDVAERTRLAGQLAQAQVQAEAARGAYADLGAEQRRLSSELQGVADAIDAAGFDAIERRYDSDVANMEALCARIVRRRLARLRAAHAFIVGRAQQHQASGREDAARALFARAERLASKTPVFDVMPTQAETLGLVHVWAKRFDDATNGTTPSLDTPVALGTLLPFLAKGAA